MSEKCYICETISPSCESHHIWPRFAGGESGPTVWLCANCHTGIHRQALNLLSKTASRKCYFTTAQLERAKPLIQYLVMALREAKENKNDQQMMNVGLKLPAGFLAVLHSLKADAGFKSMDQFIANIIRDYVRGKI